MTLISIVIPTYNSSKTLKKCLESVLNQTFKDFEILIIDGNSADNTLKIAKSFDDKRIKTFSEPDKGIYDAMNKGINLAKGNWLYFLGSDDELYSNDILHKIAQIAKKTFKRVIYGNVEIKGDAGWVKDGLIYDNEFDLKKLFTKNICHQSIFYKKDLLDSYNYNIEYKICADYDLNLNLFSKYKFEYVDIIIAKFYGGGKSKIIVDEKFNLKRTIIKYFISKLYLNSFYFIRDTIRLESLTTKNIFFCSYLKLVYYKHRIFGNERI